MGCEPTLGIDQRRHDDDHKPKIDRVLLCFFCLFVG
jgi:hypothetical protein